MRATALCALRGGVSGERSDLRPALWNGGTTRERVVAEGRFPLASDDELGTIQELRVEQKCTSQIGAFEHRLEQVRAFEVGTRKIRMVTPHSSQIGSPEVRPREIESTEIEPSQGSLG
jgi:hypothetical protein